MNQKKIIMMKKKILTICLVVALLATAVGGTLAYFKDTDKAENVFTFGNVKIEQHEQQRNKDNGSRYVKRIFAVVFPS